MKVLLGILLLVSGLSAQALTCHPDGNPAMTLELEFHGYALVTGQSYSRAVGEVFAGHVVRPHINQVSIGTTYQLYNQNGKAYQLFVKHPEFDGGGHCRARVCPNPRPSFKKRAAKLSYENTAGELVHEYYKCL